MDASLQPRRSCDLHAVDPHLRQAPRITLSCAHFEHRKAAWWCWSGEIVDRRSASLDTAQHERLSASGGYRVTGGRCYCALQLHPAPPAQQRILRLREPALELIDGIRDNPAPAVDVERVAGSARTSEVCRPWCLPGHRFAAHRRRSVIRRHISRHPGHELRRAVAVLPRRSKGRQRLRFGKLVARPTPIRSFEHQFRRCDARRLRPLWTRAVGVRCRLASRRRPDETRNSWRAITLLEYLLMCARSRQRGSKLTTSGRASAGARPVSPRCVPGAPQIGQARANAPPVKRYRVQHDAPRALRLNFRIRAGEGGARNWVE